MAEQKLPKLTTRVRFPSPAPDDHTALRSNPAFDWLVPGVAKPDRKIASGLARERLVVASDHEIGAVAAVLEKRIAADRHARMRRLGFTQQVRDIALRGARSDGDRHHRAAALELAGQRFEHACRD